MKLLIDLSSSTPRRGLVAAAAVLALAPLGAAGAHEAAGPAGLGPNVIVFDSSMSAASIQSQLDAVFATMESNQFGTSAMR